jgi:RNA polymerase sigma factor (sigma-70 family)
MAKGQIGGVLHYLRGLFRTPAGAPTDQDLLHAFASRRDEAAFTALMERHGPLVWSVCRRLLDSAQDAEDAFQATFLILARKAGSVAWREDAGNWLYAVARRVARASRARAGRRRRLEREVVMAARTEPNEGPDREACGIVVEEVQRLPEKYRRPVVLCYLEGKTYGEAARLLGWPEGTVSGRLGRARELLRRRLLRRGLALPAGGVATLLATTAVRAAVPAALAQATLRTAVTFAAAQGAPSAAATLAEEVIRAMFLSKLKFGAVLLLALAVIGTGLTVLVRGGGEPARPVPEQPLPPRSPEAAGDKPALPEAWAGRWVANPFAGAESIEVVHARLGPGGVHTYQVKDPKAIATLLKAVKITGFQNDMHPGSIPTAHVTVRRKDGTTFAAGVEDATSLSTTDGLLYLGKDFIATLGRVISDDPKAPVNLLEFLPSLPEPKPQPRVAPSARSLTAGFESLGVQYVVGGRLHEARFNDDKTLAALHKALAVVKQEEAPRGKGLPPNSRSLTIFSTDKSVFNGHTLGEDQLLDHEAGLFTLRADFFKVLTKEVSRAEGREIDLGGDNAPTERQAKRATELRELLAGLRSIRFTHTQGDKAETVVVNQPDEVKELVKALGWVEVPVKEHALTKGDRFLELETKDGKTVEVTFLNGPVGTYPLLGDLIDVAGFGQVWVSNSWKTVIHDVVFKRRLAAKERRDRETTRLVGRDLPLFLKQVVNVVAHYREGESEITGNLGRDESRAVLDVLAAGKWEQLDWTEDRWQKELAALGERAPGEFDLTPGLGFYLPVVISGEKEVLVPLCGRLTFAGSPIAKFRKAINPDKPDAVEVLPRAKAKD